MNDLLGDWKNIAIALLGALVSLGAWVFKRHLDEFKDLREKVATKSEVDVIRDEIQQRHDENVGRFDRVEDIVTGIHRRIDDLYRDLMGRD
jgi:hypothetical protein